MLNMNYKESEKAYLDGYYEGYYEGRKYLAIITGIGFALGCIIGTAINYFMK